MRTALPDVAEYPAIRFNAEDWKAILGPLVHAKAIVNRTRYRELRREVQMAVETLIVTRYFSKHDLAIRGLLFVQPSHVDVNRTAQRNVVGI